MTEKAIARQAPLGELASNTYGERYLAAINQTLFKDTSASTVFRSHFGEALFEEDRFYIIAGTDSGLLYHYIKSRGIPKGSRYLFVELPQVLALLEDMGAPQADLAVANADNWLEQANEMGAQQYVFLGRLVLLPSLGVVHGHFSDYASFSRSLKAEVDAFAWQKNLSQNERLFTLCQIENLTENQVPARCLKNAFQGKTAVLLAGGPSLDELLPWVKEHRRNLLVIAVSRISQSLLRAGIQPDISVSVDPIPINLKVSREMLEFHDGTLLVNEYHVSSNLLSSWGGQKVFMGSRYPWATPLEPENFSISGGTTVTNRAFSIAVETGVTQIILGGADFCFSQDGYTHASGSVEHARGPSPTGQQQVETNSGKRADTLNGYRESALYIDSQAEDALTRGCRTINPAAGAMRLPHVEHLPVDAIPLEPMEQSARDVLIGYVPPTGAAIRTQLYKEVLDEVDRVIKELETTKDLSRTALNYNRMLYAKGAQATATLNGEKLDRISAQLKTKYADTVAFVVNFGITRFLPILRLDNRSADEHEQFGQLYYQAYVETSDELIGLLSLAHARIMSRLEEDKPQPDLERLLEQWRRDQQPGRAIQWARQHADYVNQLPDAEQKALREFQDTFNESVEKINPGYSTAPTQAAINTSLENIPNSARESFQCQDQRGLQRLLSGLQKHGTQERAAHFVHLVEGYLAELRDEPEAAIEAYQRVGNGPAHIDALMRVFEIHSKAQNWTPALEALKVLSTLNPTYGPMYADLLYATGDVENAVEIYTDYLLAHPDDLKSMMKLGKLFHQCGVADGVAWTMGYILDREPDNQAALQILDEAGIRLDHIDAPQNSP